MHPSCNPSGLCCLELTCPLVWLCLEGTRKQSLFVREQSLIAGANYLLVVEAFTPGSDVGTASVNFLVNQPPNNGTCYVSPTEYAVPWWAFWYCIANQSVYTGIRDRLGQHHLPRQLYNHQCWLSCLIRYLSSIWLHWTNLRKGGPWLQVSLWRCGLTVAVGRSGAHLVTSRCSTITPVAPLGPLILVVYVNMSSDISRWEFSYLSLDTDWSHANHSQ